MLDMSWGTMLSYCVLAYVCTVALWACITLAAANDIDGSALSLSDAFRKPPHLRENIVPGLGQGAHQRVGLRPGRAPTFDRAGPERARFCDAARSSSIRNRSSCLETEHVS